MKSALVQFLDQSLQPAGLIWLLLLGLGMLQWRARLRRWAWVTFSIAMLFSIAAGTPLPKVLLRTLERPYSTQNIDALPEADAVLVLGGSVGNSQYEPAGLGLSDASDRIMTGVELVRRGKARHLVMGGGANIVNGVVQAEVDVVEPWLQRWNLVSGPILRLPICTNTRDEAVAFSNLTKERGWKRVMLVTSAWHMRRSEAVFRSAGVAVIPVACDFRTYPVERGCSVTEWPIVPQPGALQGFHVYCHEIIGWWYYRIRGWIKTEDACCKEMHEAN